MKESVNLVYKFPLKQVQPDMLLFEQGPNEAYGQALESLRQIKHRRKCTAHIVEVGFCMEVGYMMKFQEKYAQHQVLNEWMNWI